MRCSNIIIQTATLFFVLEPVQLGSQSLISEIQLWPNLHQLFVLMTISAFQSSRRQYSTIKSYCLFFLAICRRSSPLCFRNLRSTILVSNHSLMIYCFCLKLMSLDKIAQKSGDFPSVVCMLNISNLSGWSSRNSMMYYRTS